MSTRRILVSFGYMLCPGDRFPGPAIVEEPESTARPRPRAKHHTAERDTEAPNFADVGRELTLKTGNREAMSYTTWHGVLYRHS